MQQPVGHSLYNGWGTVPQQFHQGAGPHRGQQFLQAGQLRGPLTYHHQTPHVVNNPQGDNVQQGQGKIDDAELDKPLSHMHPVLK